MNCIDVESDLCRRKPKSNLGPLIKIHTFRCAPPHRGWTQLNYINGEFDGFFQYSKNGRPFDFSTIFNNLLTDLGKDIFKRKIRWITITGMPGAGKEPLFYTLGKTKKLGSHKVHVLTSKLLSYEAQSVEAALDDVQNQLEDVVRREGDQALERTILVLYDRAMLKLALTEVDRAQTAAFEKLKVIFYKIPAVIYMMPHLDYTPCLPLVHKYEAPKIIPALSNETMESMVKAFSSAVPVKKDQIYHFSGGYVGFSNMLLNGAQEIFEKAGGATQIKLDTGARLIQQVLDVERVQKEAKAMIERIQNFHPPAGASVCTYIRKCIHDLEAKCHFDPLEPVIVDFAPLRRGLGTTQEGGVNNVLRLLRTHNILVPSMAHWTRFG